MNSETIAKRAERIRTSLDVWLDAYYQQHPQQKQIPKNVFGEYDLPTGTQQIVIALLKENEQLQEKLAFAEFNNELAYNLTITKKDGCINVRPNYLLSPQIIEQLQNELQQTLDLDSEMIKEICHLYVGDHITIIDQLGNK